MVIEFAGMHAHRIDVLDRTDDDAVIVFVAHHFHLELFPAEHRLLDQHFVGGGRVDAALDDLDELGLVVGDAAAGAAEREARADDGGQADIVERRERLNKRLDLVRARRRQSDARHGLAEQLAVLRHVDRVGRGADHLDVEFLQHAHLSQGERAVERGLPAHGGEQRVRAFLLDDLGDDLRRDRLDVSGIGEIGIGHDRRRIGIDENDPVALVLERLAGLRAGIVELAGLADDDRAGADDQDRFDVGSFRHSVLRHTKKGRAFARPLLPQRDQSRARRCLDHIWGAGKRNAMISGGLILGKYLLARPRERFGAALPRPSARNFRAPAPADYLARPRGALPRRRAHSPEFGFREWRNSRCAGRPRYFSDRD